LRRREFLGATLSTLVLPGRSFAGGQEAAASLIVHTERPQNLETPLDYLDRLITPTQAFFVRSHFGPPSLQPKRSVIVEGKKKVELGADDLRKLKTVKVTAVLECAGNSRGMHRPRVPGVQWTHGAMGQAEWTGVRLADVLERVGVPEGATTVMVQGADAPPGPKVPRFARGIPLERALDPSTIIALKMNGELLPHAHGAPMRLVMPGWTGNHWVKWLRSIRVQTDVVGGFYMEKAYRMPKSPIAPGAALNPADTDPVSLLALRSVIARPTEGAKLAPGSVEIAGVAFTGDAGIDRVEVSLDDGKEWIKAQLEGERAPGRWQVFRHRFDAKPGGHAICARAFDSSGRAQPEEATWNPSGYLWNGWHRVRFEVAG
jgi:DMSO/TMAO reductase YedYZ molybdopterin-dependent catalytic subunit